MSGRWTVGVDFGGTNTKIGLVAPSGRLGPSRVIRSSALRGPRAFVDAVSSAVDDLARSVGARPARLRGLAVGAPGPVDAARGIVHTCVNVPGWREVPLQRLFERRLGCRCRVDNDANVVTLGEWRLGAGRGARHLVCLTLGTGVGGGIICDGRLLRGAAGSAGEIGHMVVQAGGPRCGCGRRGCLEALVGTTAILALGRRALRQGAPRLRHIMEGRGGGRLAPRWIGQAARAGDRRAQAVWAEIGRRLGLGLANVVNILSPERIILAGGIANNWSSFGPAMRRTLRAEAMCTPGRAVRVVRAALGDEAGILGAAVLVWETGRGET